MTGWLRWPRNWFTVVGLGLIAVFYVIAFADPDNPSVGLIYPMVSLPAAVGVLVGILINRPTRKLGWLFVLGAQICYAVGDLAHELSDTESRLGYVFYFAQYPMIGLALFVFIRNRTPGWHRPTLLDTAVLATSVGLLWWIYMLAPLARADNLPALAFPVLDLLVVTMTLRLVLGGGTTSVSYRLLLAGFGSLLLGDMVRGFETAFEVDFISGYIGGVWMLSAVLLSAAALHPSMTVIDQRAQSAPEHATTHRIMLLGAAALVAPILLGIENLRGNNSEVLKIAIGCGALFVLVVARMSGLITEQRDMATTDALTGLRTRRHLVQQLAAQYSPGAEPPGLIIVDADHFKRVNDTYGHPAGDAVLIELAQRLRSVCRSSDVLARFGGEEFVLLLPNTGADTAATVAERVRQNIAATPILLPDGMEVSVTVSVGVAGPGCSSPDILLNAADQALYVAKRDGRNRVVAHVG